MLELTINDRVATITLDRPPANAWDVRALDSLEEIISVLENAEDVDLAVVQSAGRHFSAGADIKMMAAAVEHQDMSSQADFAARIQQLFTRWERLPLPSLAILHGAATGGGLELALACDLRIAAENCRLGLPEGRLGLLAAGGGTQRLCRAIGRGLAMRLMLTCELLTGRQAYDIGLVEWCFPAAELNAEAEQVIRQIQAHAGPAQRLMKRCVTLAESPEGYDLETSGQRSLYETKDTQERLKAFVTQGRNR